jgi:phage tail-like protein
MMQPAAAVDYPLVAYNYHVVVGNVSMRFAKVEGLVWERKAITYRDGLSFRDGERIALCRVESYTTLSMQQGVMASDPSLHDWLLAGDARWLQVQLCQADGRPVVAWQARQAIPVKLTGSSLDAMTNEVCIDTLELRATGWSIKHPL